MSDLRVYPVIPGSAPQRSPNRVECFFATAAQGTSLYSGRAWLRDHPLRRPYVEARALDRRSARWRRILCQRLPETDRAAHEIAQEYCASGLCNPVYFTVGNLLRYLRRFRIPGISAAEIVKKYVYFTAACGGPCRFGMYEAEFRTALKAAGFEGFRVLSFSQDHGIYASTGHSGLQFSADFG